MSTRSKTHLLVDAEAVDQKQAASVGKTFMDEHQDEALAYLISNARSPKSPLKESLRRSPRLLLSRDSWPQRSQARDHMQHDDVTAWSADELAAHESFANHVFKDWV